MTATQSARLLGFRANLAMRGVAVTLVPDRGTFSALVEQYQGPSPTSAADSGARVLDAELRGAVRLAILREDLGAAPVSVGDTFRDSENLTDYRVTRIERLGVDVADRFTCERESVPVQ